MTMVLSLLENYGPSILAFAAFGLLHSVGAREPCKEAFARWFGPFFVDHFWRIVYSILSFAALYLGVSNLHWSRNPEFDVWLISYPQWLWGIIVVVHLSSIGVIYISFFQSDYLEFLGLRQAAGGIRSVMGGPSDQSVKLFGTDRLDVRGIYGWVRHPMLAGGLLFLLTSGPSFNNLIFTGMYTAYMVIGAYYEERRLVRIFGEDYRRYQRDVGAFFPRIARLSWRWNS